MDSMGDEMDERSEAFERGLKTMERVALELYRRGREEAREELEAVKRERDEARAEVEHAYREGGALYEAKIAEREAFRRGAEAMREACAARIGSDPALLMSLRSHCESALRALPIPEES